MKKFLVAIFMTLMVASQSAYATTSVLLYQDHSIGTSVLPGALNMLGLDATYASDSTEFNNYLTSSTWDLVIFAEQNNSIFSESATLLNSYVNNGGKLLADTWRGDSGLSSLMQATMVGSNYSTITTDAHEIFDGIGSEIYLSDPGWGVHSVSWEATGGAVGLGTLGTGSAVILGNNGNTLLYGPLTDTYMYETQGSTFVANGISYLLKSEPNPTVPAPGALLLAALGTTCIRKFRLK